MRVTPKTEQEVASAGLFKAGVYDFEVMDATEKQSKAGNDMLELKIRAYDAEGKQQTIFDYLVDTDGSAYKVRNFAVAVGMLKQYDSGNLPAHSMIGLTGQCRVIIKKDRSGEYPDKNAITDYVKAGTPATNVGGPRAEPDLDDSIPF